MSRYLLDTNILSELIHDPLGPAAQRARAAGERARTSVIVAAELRFGAAKKQSARLTNRVEDILQTIVPAPFDAPADRTYGDLRAELERKGQRIGDVDMLIAAHALALDCTLVTANIREFERVDGLRVENWLA